MRALYGGLVAVLLSLNLHHVASLLDVRAAPVAFEAGAGGPNMSETAAGERVPDPAVPPATRCGGTLRANQTRTVVLPAGATWRVEAIPECGNHVRWLRWGRRGGH